MNYYEILEIATNSNSKEIKKHYYKLCKKYHPDKNNGFSDAKFKSLSEAYSTLSNPKKRYLYDMKLLMTNSNNPLNNYDNDFIFHFSDSELDILYNYYQRLSQSSEFKLFKLLFKSIPNFKNDFKKKSNSLLKCQDFKYIDTRNLNESFIIHLNRSLKDVYLNDLKEIIIQTKNYTYDIFITHSDYSLEIQLNKLNSLSIHIQTILPEKYTLNGNDIYYNHRINLYEYYFIDLFPITLPNDLQINLKNSVEFNNSVKIPYLGLKGESERGDLYIYKELDLSIPRQKKNHYREILKEIFT